MSCHLLLQQAFSFTGVHSSDSAVLSLGNSLENERSVKISLLWQRVNGKSSTPVSSGCVHAGTAIHMPDIHLCGYPSSSNGLSSCVLLPFCPAWLLLNYVGKNFEQKPPPLYLCVWDPAPVGWAVTGACDHSTAKELKSDHYHIWQFITNVSIKRYLHIMQVIQNLFCPLLTLHAYLVRLTVNGRLV